MSSETAGLGNAALEIVSLALLISFAIIIQYILGIY